MLTNTVECTIERRLLVNYRIDPEVVERCLPAPFRPQLVSGWAVGGVCFIRLGSLRPNHSPSALGITTENVAHRFAVEWDDDAGTQVGVFIPRRDTNSRITALAGDRIFPGVHRMARFEVHEQGSELRLEVQSRDGMLGLSVTAQGGPSTRRRAVRLPRAGHRLLPPRLARLFAQRVVRLSGGSATAQPELGCTTRDDRRHEVECVR